MARLVGQGATDENVFSRCWFSPNPKYILYSQSFHQALAFGDHIARLRRLDLGCVADSDRMGLLASAVTRMKALEELSVGLESMRAERAVAFTRALGGVGATLRSLDLQYAFTPQPAVVDLLVNSLENLSALRHLGLFLTRAHGTPLHHVFRAIGEMEELTSLRLTCGRVFVLFSLEMFANSGDFGDLGFRVQGVLWRRGQFRGPWGKIERVGGHETFG